MSHSSHVHVGGHGDNDATRTNRFELIAALLLGIAGTLTALSTFEAGLWHGQASLRYATANKIATAAAAEKSRAILEMSKDSSVDIQAKQQILQGNDNPAAKARTDQIAGYLYVFQLSDEGYKAMGFPEEMKTSIRSGSDTPENDRKAAAMLDQLLKRAWETDLSTNENYRETMLGKSKEQSTEADHAFVEGVESKENAEKFEMADVIFAVSLFFTGISLVFRTKVRWSITLVGTVFLIGGMIFMATLHWTLS